MTTDPADMGEVVERVKALADDTLCSADRLAGDFAEGVPIPNLYQQIVLEQRQLAADLRSLLAHLASLEAENKALREAEDAQPFKDALHDLVMLKAQADIGCVPPPTRAQWGAAWAEAEELTRIEP